MVPCLNSLRNTQKINLKLHKSISNLNLKVKSAKNHILTNPCQTKDNSKVDKRYLILVLLPTQLVILYIKKFLKKNYVSSLTVSTIHDPISLPFFRNKLTNMSSICQEYADTNLTLKLINYLLFRKLKVG